MLIKFLNQKKIYILCVFLVILAGLSIRFFDLTNPPLDFNPVRQIHSAIIARGFYVFLPNSSLTGFERDKAWSFSSELWIEPPILEYITAWSYAAAGDAYLWIARIYSILFWTLGGVALFFLMKSLSGKAGALAGLIFYLFLPFGIFASRAFQPDPLMVASLCFAYWMLERWSKNPSWKNAVLSGVFCGFAILVKQVAVFFVAGPLVVVLLQVPGFKKGLRSLKVWAIGLITILPTLIYNIYGVFIDGFLKMQYSLRFFPELFSDPLFYYRWASKINQTVGWVPLMIALAGIVFLVDRHRRWWFASLFIGYFAYGLVFAYHISTHDYYQEPLIPLVAIGIGLIVEAVYQQTGSLKNLFSLAAIGVLTTAGCLYTLWSVRNDLNRSDYRDQPALWRRLGREMHYGEPAVAGLFDDYGVRLMYWGYTMPMVWESAGDIKMRELSGRQQVMDDIQTKLEGKRFFIVTDFNELQNQSELEEVLNRYHIYEQGSGYKIYDLSWPLDNP